MNNRKLILDAQQNMKIITEKAPQPQKGEVLVRVMANGICGSDIHFYKEGRLGNFVVTKPYTPGHECSGFIAGLGEGVTSFSEGDRVVIEPGIPCGLCGLCKSGRYNLCKEVVFLSAPPVDGTFCDYIALRQDMVFPFLDKLTYEQAAFVEPVAVAVHAVNRAGSVYGKDGVIVGAGSIGMLTLQAFKAAGGNRVAMVDVLDKRLEIAKALGADEIINPAKTSAAMFDNIGDIVFETAGSAKATETLFNMARTGGTVVQVGWPGENIVPMNIANFIDKELYYTSVNRYANAYPTSLSLLAEGHIKVNELISKKFDFADAPAAFKYAAENQSQVVKIMVCNQ